MISKIVEKIFSILFPYQCIICHSEDTLGNICNHCIGKLELNRDIQLPWIFSLYHYKDDRVHTCIHHLKNYPDQLLVYHLLDRQKRMIHGWIMGVITYYNIRNIVLVPTPIHNSRFIDRGYNQAEIIAHGLHQVLQLLLPNIPILVNTQLIKKTKQTEKQALITDREKRFKNVINIFTKTKSEILFPTNTLIIIIDDVTTTGGTLSEIYHKFPDQPTVAFTLAH